MIILLTAPPRTGKSTIIDELIRSPFSSAHWVIAKEVRQKGERVGFQAKNSFGDEKLISHKTDIESTTMVGSYKVDADAVDYVYSEILKTPGLKVVDEIGDMQLSSARFTKAVDLLLSSPEKTRLIATIHQKDKRLRRYRSTKNVLILTATPANRDHMPNVITNLEKNEKTIAALTPSQFKVFNKLLINYLSKAQSIQLGKLLDNALFYLASNRVKKTKRGVYSVYGKHNEHRVNRRFNRLSCDCNLFQGAGIYKGSPGECSHVQAVKLLLGSSPLR